MRVVHVAALLALAAALPSGSEAPSGKSRPNVLLIMADDLGWGDVGYNGHPKLLTPHLDAMAEAGLRFDRFYAAAPVCSPTRASCLTGRNGHRMGIGWANEGHLPDEELTLAEILRAQGYATGHFGKWHLGTLTRDVKDGHRGGRPVRDEHFSPPWEHGYDVCFSTESSVPTWDPMKHPGKDEPWGTRYWNERGEIVTENLKGDDSRVMVDRVVPFVQAAVEREKPFFATVWFHAPHRPWVAGEEYRKLYADEPDHAQRYYGCITAMDEQIGRLRSTLRELGVAENTLVWFCSDNGPSITGNANADAGSAGPHRGAKDTLWEGGVRVPGLVEWPARVAAGSATGVPACTSDFLPTIVAALGIEVEGMVTPLDGVSLLPLLDGEDMERALPIAFSNRSAHALIDGDLKLLRPKGAKRFSLFDLAADASEASPLGADRSEDLERLTAAWAAWRDSVKRSRNGDDYVR